MLISAERGDIKLSEEPVLSRNVGVQGQNVLRCLAYVYANPNKGLREKLSSLMDKWTKEFDIKDLCAGLEEEGKLRVNYEDLISLDLALASYGHRQLIIFLTQLIISPEGSIIMIEEPELSLHPEALVKLPLLFAEMIKDFNKQIILTTHSPLLLLAISRAVQHGLSVDDIAVYEVYRNEKGFTRVRELELTDEGYPEHVPSFARVEAELFKELMEREE